MQDVLSLFKYPQGCGIDVGKGSNLVRRSLGKPDHGPVRI